MRLDVRLARHRSKSLTFDSHQRSKSYIHIASRISLEKALIELSKEKKQKDANFAL